LQHPGETVISHSLAKLFTLLECSQLEHLGDHAIGIAQGLVYGLPPDQPGREGLQQRVQ